MGDVIGVGVDGEEGGGDEGGFGGESGGSVLGMMGGI